MRTYPLGAFVKSTVALVMTVTMNRRKGDVPGVRTMAIKVMECAQVIRLEEESARRATPFLVLQKRRESPRYAWVVAPSCRPIAPVPVIQAGRPWPFDVSNHRYARVLVECRPGVIPDFPALAGRGIPITLESPPPPRARMPAKRPASALLIQLAVVPMEGHRTDHRALVICPASDARVEYPAQVRLRAALC